MDEPTNYAVVENGLVTNVIWLCAANAVDFPSAVPVYDRLVAIGDSLTEGVFMRGGVPVPTEEELLILLQAENGA